MDQLLKVQELLSKPSKLRICLYVKDQEIRVQHLTPICDPPPLYASSSLGFGTPPGWTTKRNTPAIDKSVKKLLAQLIEVLEKTDLLD